MGGCDCKDCKDKKQAKLEAIDSVEKKIDEKFKKGMYTVGLPKAKIKEAIEEARKEV